MCPTINLGPRNPRKQGAASKKYAKFYNTTRWKRLRAAKVKADPLCQRCLAKGIVKPVDEVHHRKPFDPDAPDYDLIFDFANLISLCYQCHREEQTPLRRANDPNSKERILEDLRRREQAVRDASKGK
jgi:5-methylcytosine-specific restriction protein A